METSARAASLPPPESSRDRDLRARRRLDKYFESVCELDIMFNLEKAHFILDEMVMNGCIVETNKANVLKPIALMEKASEETIFKR